MREPAVLTFPETPTLPRGAQAPHSCTESVSPEGFCCGGQRGSGHSAMKPPPPLLWPPPRSLQLPEEGTRPHCKPFLPSLPAAAESLALPASPFAEQGLCARSAPHAPGQPRTTCNQAALTGRGFMQKKVITSKACHL